MKQAAWVVVVFMGLNLAGPGAWGQGLSDQEREVYYEYVGEEYGVLTAKKEEDQRILHLLLQETDAAKKTGLKAQREKVAGEFDAKIEGLKKGLAEKNKMTVEQMDELVKKGKNRPVLTVSEKKIFDQIRKELPEIPEGKVKDEKEVFKQIAAQFSVTPGLVNDINTIGAMAEIMGQAAIFDALKGGGKSSQTNQPASTQTNAPPNTQTNQAPAQ